MFFSFVCDTPPLAVDGLLCINSLLFEGVSLTLKIPRHLGRLGFLFPTALLFNIITQLFKSDYFKNTKMLLISSLNIQIRQKIIQQKNSICLAVMWQLVLLPVVGTEILQSHTLRALPPPAYCFQHSMIRKILGMKISP